MALPILVGLAVKGGISITWKVILAIAASSAVAGGAKAAYEVGEHTGKERGRINQANVDKEKFRQLASEMLEQSKNYEKAKEEWDAIFSYYENYIMAAKQKYNIDEEEEKKLEVIIDEYKILSQLKKIRNDAEEGVTLSELNVKYLRAFIASLKFFAECDGTISKEENIIIQNTLSAIINNPNVSGIEKTMLEEITKNDRLTFLDVKDYLDEISSFDLDDIKNAIQKIIITNGIDKKEKEEYAKFLKYYTSRKSNYHASFDGKKNK